LIPDVKKILAQAIAHQKKIMHNLKVRKKISLPRKVPLPSKNNGASVINCFA